VEKLIIKDTHFVTAGAVSGKWWRGSHEGFPEGFLVVNIKDNQLDYYYETYGWEAKK
jgi:Icc protein